MFSVLREGQQYELKIALCCKAWFPIACGYLDCEHRLRLLRPRLNANSRVNRLRNAQKPVLKLHAFLDITHALTPSRWIKQKRRLTGVSSTAKKRKRLTTVDSAILISSIANLMPMQLRGPIPNGMKTFGFGFMGLSVSHLHTNSRNYSYYSKEQYAFPMFTCPDWTLPARGNTLHRNVSWKPEQWQLSPSLCARHCTRRPGCIPSPLFKRNY